MTPERLQHQLDLYKGLVEVSALINGITASAELLPAILDVARRVIGTEAASLFLVNDNGDLELAVASSDDSVDSGHPRKLIVPRGHGISGWVLQNGQSLLVPDAYADPRFFRDADRQTGFRTRSILCVPLVRDGKEIGVLQVLNPLQRDSFDVDDLTAFEAYGTMAATAIYKLRAIERQRERERIEQEFTFARDIQKSFMPQTLPERDGVQFATAYRPARFVGGDFYDVIEVRNGQFFFVIGDVSGKGMPAALLMAQALSTLRLILHSRMNPSRALNRWNDLLCEQTIRGMFITALLGRVDTTQRQVELASAGHCQPICARLDGPPEDISVPGGPPLGIAPGRMYHNVTATLGEGDWLITYTDGLSESFNAAREPLHATGVSALLHGPFAEAAAVVCALEEGERQHRGDADPHDDLTMLVFGFR